MVNSVVTQTIVDGERNVVTKTHIVGDGSGEESDTTLLDVSTFTGTPATVKIVRIGGYLSGFSASLAWDATANVDIVNLPSDDTLGIDAVPYGGLINNTGAGKTGDILFTTVGLGAGDEGTIILEMKKT